MSLSVGLQIILRLPKALGPYSVLPTKTPSILPSFINEAIFSKETGSVVKVFSCDKSSLSQYSLLNFEPKNTLSNFTGVGNSPNSLDLHIAAPNAKPPSPIDG